MPEYPSTVSDRIAMTPDDDALPLRPLGNYRWPSMPTTETLRRLRGRLYDFFRADDQPAIARDELRKATRQLLDNVAAPPACGPLLGELDKTLADWVGDPSSPDRLKLIVLPPCDEHGLVETWANLGGHALLEAPARGTLICDEPVEPMDLSGVGLLVIPRLEYWFLRHHNGLHHIRALLDQLTRIDRPCLIGCNSWAWSFLCKAAGADIMLPQAWGLQAFDQVRLRRWFSALAEREKTHRTRFRLPDSGKDVLAVDKDGDAVTDYLETLAAHSLGIPWVAWHLWRDSLRSGDNPAAIEHTDGSEIEPGERTLWMAPLDEFRLPGAIGQSGLQILQALLIHGDLDVRQLREVLPVVGEAHILPALISAGFVERQGEQLHCRPAAYPAIRSGLKSAGFPMDEL